MARIPEAGTDRLKNGISLQRPVDKLSTRYAARTLCEVVKVDKILKVAKDDPDDNAIVEIDESQLN